jgi:Ala-tRNA(Pro) deacylase
MPTQRLISYLEEQGIPYQTLEHTTAYTAQGVAASLHMRGREVAKTTVVKLDGRFEVAVLPAPRHVDFAALRALTGAQAASLATEAELARLFPGCEVGAMPPFGNLYGLPVWVDEQLAKDDAIAFNAGTHREAVKMSFADFCRAVGPRIGAFAH